MRQLAIRLAKRWAGYLAVSVAIAAFSNALFESGTWQFWTFDLTLCFIAGYSIGLFEQSRSRAPIDSTKEAA